MPHRPCRELDVDLEPTALLIWLVDPQYHDRPPPVISGREAWDGYAPPSDIIRPPENIPVPVICYNNTVRLQCPSTGLTSPVLVIRRVDNGTTAYGGEGAKRDGFQGKCPMGELTGEPVSQLHKVSRNRGQFWCANWLSLAQTRTRLLLSCMLHRTCPTCRCTGKTSGTQDSG